MRNHATLHDVAGIGEQSHDVLAVFGHVKQLAAIFVNVGYLKMIVRLSSYDIVEVARPLCDFNL